MKLNNNQLNYGLIAIVLHWLIALLTYGLFGLGLWMVSLGYYDAWYQKFYGRYSPNSRLNNNTLVFIN